MTHSATTMPNAVAGNATAPHPQPRRASASARLDALPWTPFHTRLVLALGITWVLDGLEVTLAGSVAGALMESPSLRFTEGQVGAAATFYLLGAVCGSVLFGWMADRMGRKQLFFITLALYLLATGATAFAWDTSVFMLFRFLTGAGIGGEYAAINSAIQEFVPARHRGRTDIIVNGSFWLGAALGAFGSVMFLRPGFLPADWGWRGAFAVGAVLGVGILFLRRHIPESPRWLAIRGRSAEAHAIIDRIEQSLPAAQRQELQQLQRQQLQRQQQQQRPGAAQSAPESESESESEKRPHPNMLQVAHILLNQYRRRTLVGLALMASQAFFYNAIFFTYALVLGRFYDVPSASVGWYLIPFCLGNFLGPVFLGRYFDTWGRRRMIALCYAVSGLMLLGAGAVFLAGATGALGQTLAWSLTFFFASAAAGSAYLTVAESFPMQMRGLAIALFYAFGTGVGGALAPWLFGMLIGSGERINVAWGYAFGSALMIAAAFVQWRWGMDSEGRSLEELAAT